MSSGAKKMKDKIVTRKVHTTVQVLLILEKVAKKKNFFQRLSVAFKYLFFKKFEGFFKD